MPITEYENRTDSVLAWKRNQKLGRFDPNAPSIEQQKIKASEREVEERGKSDAMFIDAKVFYHSPHHTDRQQRGGAKQPQYLPMRYSQTSVSSFV